MSYRSVAHLLGLVICLIVYVTIAAIGHHQIHHTVWYIWLGWVDGIIYGSILTNWIKGL